MNTVPSMFELLKNHNVYYMKKVDIRDVDYDDNYSIDYDDETNDEDMDSYYTEFYM